MALEDIACIKFRRQSRIRFTNTLKTTRSTDRVEVDRLL